MPARDQDPQLVVLNQRNRPVEVHVGRRVIRIPPLATASVPLAGDRDSAQLNELVRNRTLVVLGAPAPAAPKQAAAPKKATAEKKAPARKKAAAAPKPAATKKAPATRTAAATKKAPARKTPPTKATAKQAAGGRSRRTTR